MYNVNVKLEKEVISLQKHEMENAIEQLNVKRVNALYHGTTEQITHITNEFNALQNEYKNEYGAFYKPKMLNV